MVEGKERLSVRCRSLSQIVVKRLGLTFGLPKELQLTLQALIEISDGGIETRIRSRTIELRRSIGRPFVAFVQTGADSLSLSHSWV
jgi:hypothetical protein